MSTNYKNHKLIAIVQEFENTGSRYLINGVDLGKAIFFWRENQRMYDVIPKGAYKITNEGGNVYLDITDLTLLSRKEKIQICYEFASMSSTYEVDFNVDANILKDRYNELVNDVKTLFRYIQNNMMTADGQDAFCVLPTLETDEVWVKTDDGWRGLNIGNLEENIQKMIKDIESLKHNIFKELSEEKDRLILEIKGKFNEEVDMSKQKITSHTDSEIERINATGIDGKLDKDFYYKNSFSPIKTTLFKKGYKKETSYMRIPSITKTSQGTLICGCDLRYNGSSDMPNHIDILLRISDNNGYSFDREVIISRGSKGITDSALGHDPTNGITYLLCYNNTKFITQTGGDWDFFVYKSIDGGYTWDEGTSLKHLLPEGKEYLLQGPASGICKNGKIYFGVQSWKGSNCNSHIMYSNDGIDWTISNPVPNLSSECTVFEYENLICLGTRNEDNTTVNHRGRIAYYTKDDGATWIPFNEIIKTTRCQSSSLSLTKELYLTSYVEGPEGASFPRKDMYISNNYGSKLKLVDGNTDGYSVMAKDNEYLYVLYERQGDIEFQRFDINLFMQYEYNEDSVEYPLLLGDTMYCTGRYKNIMLKQHPKSLTITRISNFKTTVGTFCLDSDVAISNVVFSTSTGNILISGATTSKTYTFKQYPSHLKYYKMVDANKCHFVEFEYPERSSFPIIFNITDPTQVPTLDFTDVSSNVYRVSVPEGSPSGIYKIFGWSGFPGHTTDLKIEFYAMVTCTFIFKQSSSALENNVFVFSNANASIVFRYVNGTYENYNISERGRIYLINEESLNWSTYNGEVWLGTNVIYAFRKNNFSSTEIVTLNPTPTKEPIKILNESSDLRIDIQSSKLTKIKINEPTENKPYLLTLEPYNEQSFLPVYQH